jgi:uncharacterized C2H2 Zn-finger protein
MWECKDCGKEFKTERGLKLHVNKCTAPKKEETKELSDSVKRKIDKLIDAKNSCLDAEHKHKIEMEIKELKGQ